MKALLSKWDTILAYFVFVVLFVVLFARLEAQATQLENVTAELDAIYAAFDTIYTELDEINVGLDVVRANQPGPLTLAMLATHKTQLEELRQRVRWIEVALGWR